MSRSSSLKTPMFLWGAVTLFFAFQFILRLSAGILREDIIQRFSIDAAAFGSLAGYYYLGYAGMQIPLGFMLDRFNFRFVSAISIVTTAIGALTFITAESWPYVMFGRFLIGAGSAGAFLSVVKVIKTFFPERMHSILIGFSFTFGLLGAVVGSKPTKIWFDQFGYVSTFQTLIVIALIIAGLILVINDKKITKFELEQDQKALSFSQTFKLLFNPTILFIGVCGGLMVGSLEGFADVWAMPFFNQIYGFSEYDSIFAVSVVYFGMCAGGAILGYCAEVFNSNTLMIFITGVLTTLVFLIVFYLAPLSYSAVISLMFFMGILCCYQVLVFALTSQLVDKSCAGLAIAIINCINMSFGHFFHVVISKLIQNYWDGATNIKGLPLYSVDTYIISLSPVPIACMIGTLGFLYLSLKQKKGKLNKISL